MGHLTLYDTWPHAEIRPTNTSSFSTLIGVKVNVTKAPRCNRQLSLPSDTYHNHKRACGITPRYTRQTTVQVTRSWYFCGRCSVTRLLTRLLQSGWVQKISARGWPVSRCMSSPLQRHWVTSSQRLDDEAWTKTQASPCPPPPPSYTPHRRRRWFTMHTIVSTPKLRSETQQGRPSGSFTAGGGWSPGVITTHTTSPAMEAGVEPFWHMSTHLGGVSWGLHRVKHCNLHSRRNAGVSGGWHSRERLQLTCHAHARGPGTATAGSEPAVTYGLEFGLDTDKYGASVVAMHWFVDC